jgi:predicted NBD/HSP70 family sugar kinase
MAEKSKKPSDEDILATAKDRFVYAIERESHNKTRQKEDIRFAASSPDDPWQWETKTLQSRQLHDRPVLTINKLPLHIRQVTNDIRQNRPQVRFRPADDKSDPEVADILNGVVRHIEAHSQADMAYDSCVLNQVTHGEGYIRVLADFVSDESFDQDIFIRRVDDPFRVHLDPDRLDPVGSDAKWGFIDDDMSEDEFNKQYPDAEPIDWKFASDLTWFPGDKRVRVVEYFEVEETEKKLLLWGNGSTSFEGDPMPQGVYMGENPIKERMSTKCKVIWRKLGGAQILDTKEFPSKYIPIIRSVGNEWKVDGKTYISGIVRNAKDSQRMYNVAQSAIVERVLLAPKAPWTASVEAIKGHENIWQTANTEPHSFLPYNGIDEGGNQIEQPSRTQPATVEPGLSQIAMGASDDIKAETGQFDASLGQKSNETSGKAIMARQREGDTAAFHYIDNFGQSVRHLGVIILDMIPRIYDTKRVAKILGEDGDMATAELDPQLPEAMQKVKGDKGALKRIFNPNVGFYDVYVTTGPSYTTRRVEAAEAMTQMVQGNPELWGVIGDQIVKSMDWPGAENMAERLKLTLIPPVQEMLGKDEGEPEIPPQIKGAMGQMQQQIQQMDQALQGTMGELEKAENDKRQLEFKLQQAESKALKADTDNYVLKAEQKLEADKQQAIQEVQASIPQPVEQPPAEGQDGDVAPMFEALIGGLQQIADQQAAANEQLIAVVQESGASTQAAIENVAQTLMAERMQPRTVRLSSGKTIEINPAQMAQ